MLGDCRDILHNLIGVLEDRGIDLLEDQRGGTGDIVGFIDVSTSVEGCVEIGVELFPNFTKILSHENGFPFCGKVYKNI